MRIISATPGPTTTERILELIITHPNGIIVKELSHQLNRPVSMINHCLKCLTASKKVCARLSDDGKQWVYYPYILSQLRKKSNKIDLSLYRISHLHELQSLGVLGNREQGTGNRE